MNGAEEAVSDTGPLISLERLPNGHQWMQELYTRILIPPSVADELIAGGYEDVGSYEEHFGVESLLRVSSVRGAPSPPEIKHLHSGEREATRLALDLDLELLVEEERGRNAAERLGIPYSGIAGQILIAVRENVLSRSEGRRQLKILLTRGRVNQNVFDVVWPQL